MTAVASQLFQAAAGSEGSFVLMIDPMLATGGSAVAASICSKPPAPPRSG